MLRAEQEKHTGSEIAAIPFQIETSDEAVMDLKNRLAQTRWPSDRADASWHRGLNQLVCASFAPTGRTNLTGAQKRPDLIRFRLPTSDGPADKSGLRVIWLADLTELVGAPVVQSIHPEAGAQVRHLRDHRLFIKQEGS